MQRIYFKFFIFKFYINLAAYISDNKYESVNWKTLYNEYITYNLWSLKIHFLAPQQTTCTWMMRFWICLYFSPEGAPWFGEERRGEVCIQISKYPECVNSIFCFLISCCWHSLLAVSLVNHRSLFLRWSSSLSDLEIQTF